MTRLDSARLELTRLLVDFGPLWSTLGSILVDFWSPPVRLWTSLGCLGRPDSKKTNKLDDTLMVFAPEMDQNRLQRSKKSDKTRHQTKKQNDSEKKLQRSIFFPRMIMRNMLLICFFVCKTHIRLFED